MNCSQSYLNTEAMIFVLQSINFHHQHKNMHAACMLPAGSVQIHTDEWNSQYRWTWGHCNISTVTSTVEKQKTTAVGLAFFSCKIYFILLGCCQNYPFQWVLEIEPESVLSTPLNEMSVIRGLACVQGI